jgi:sugar phosphate isomerase/epimerase
METEIEKEEFLMTENLFISVPIEYVETEKELIEKYRFNLELKIFSYHLDELRLNYFSDAAEFVKDLGIRVTFHAPFVDLSPGGFDEKVRKVSEERFMEVLDYAVLFNPENIVVHPGFNEIIHGQFFDIWKERSEITWKKVFKYAENINVKISFENIFEHDARVLETLLGLADSELAGICIDVGHHNVFSKKPLVEYFEKFGEKIFEVHLHDNNGDFDWHKAVGEGSINFYQVFDFVKKYCPNTILTLEPHDKETLFKSLKNVTEILEHYKEDI